MDITSYLLGKQAGGGSAPTLQTKSVTITQNTTTEVTPDAGYDGLDKVNVTTNVAGTFVVPSGVNLRFSNSTTNDWTFLNNIEFSSTDYSYMFDGCTNLTEMPTLDTSGITVMTGMFRECNNLVTTKLYDTSDNTSFYLMFSNCKKITTAPAMDTSKATSIQSVFAGCDLLQNVPVYDLSSVTGYMNNAFVNCPSLTNESLNNIMASLLTAINYPGTKTLARIGLTSTQASTCTTLSNWTALSAAGWTTGY